MAGSRPTRWRVRRRVAVAAAVVAVVAVVAGAALPYLVWNPAGLKHEGFELITVGMTRSEVEALLGGPPGVYYPGCRTAVSSAEGYECPGATRSVWRDDRARYEVWFTPDGRVACLHQRAVYSSTPYSNRYAAFLDRLLSPVAD